MKQGLTYWRLVLLVILLAGILIVPFNILFDLKPLPVTAGQHELLTGLENSLGHVPAATNFLNGLVVKASLNPTDSSSFFSTIRQLPPFLNQGRTIRTVTIIFWFFFALLTIIMFINFYRNSRNDTEGDPSSRLRLEVI